MPDLGKKLPGRPIEPRTASNTLRLFISFLVFYILLIFYARARCFRDPGSAFFDPWTAYDLSYSSVRIGQGDSYIESFNNETTANTKSSSEPDLCIGIASVARYGVGYFQSTVGTVLEGLSNTERADIHLILFIAHTDPSEHPSYEEPWLHELADQVLLYDPAEVDIDHVRSLETDAAKAFGREKGLFDYTYLLKACEAVNAPYTMILEDDVVAMDGWYHRTIGALASAEQQTRALGASKWLYLRLFYTEEFFGWNSEDWPIFLSYSILAVCLVACACSGARQCQPRLHSRLSTRTIFMFSGICTPLLIGLFFAAGRVSMVPIQQGVHQMPRFGCCSQAFVFPRSRVPDLVDLYQSKHIGYVDTITEEFADAENEIRWAVTPIIMQHAGRRSSKGVNKDTNTLLRHKSKGELSEVEKLWNFGFELNDADALRSEHKFFSGGSV
ncbi:hypothetical protein PENARI_c008G03881 [Penicillium arizonense]|uniref:Integral membrane protein n=1 Tax=Penicillium arizonense TaxID=1835702 RepID=A0A1F5LJD7_PENAI|nr:hypothetical protein PENARI_c008G03881 [Penicillium arizonense]OGE53314.1 hypothetical protein PENARI_c008G03881 [Penicillium arizonense]